MTKPTPQEREAKLQKQLEGMSRGSVNHEPLTRELILLKLDRLKKPHWSVAPSFVLLVLAVVLALLALPQVQSLLPERLQIQQSPSAPQGSASSPEGQDSNADRR